MIVGHHIVISAYGFWLPNDPRGSWSTYVGSDRLYQFGPANPTTETRSVAHVPHDHHKRRQAKTALKYPPVHFSGLQARAIGRGFGTYVRTAGLTVWACAIMPDHAHLFVQGHRVSPKAMSNQLKGDATEQLLAEELHPFQTIRDTRDRVPKCFAVGEWTEDIADEHAERVIRYIQQNPVKAGLKPQRWPFVVPYS
jgi:REP element-mobilizing transposase RayT